VKGGHLRLHGEQRIIRAEPACRLLHGADGGPEEGVRPDHHADLPGGEYSGEVRQYVVGTSTTGRRLPHSARKAKISAGLDCFEWMRMASAPAARKASPRVSASAR